jgi:hypothetical protein
MVREAPARAFVRKDSSGARGRSRKGMHGRLFLEAVFLHDIERAPFKRFWQKLFDNQRAVRRD